MPCGYDGYQPPRRDRQGATLDELTQMLCWLMTQGEEALESGREWSVIRMLRANPALCAWWQRHKQEDKAAKERADADRAAREARERAIAKLTPEERAALGINRGF